MDFCQIIRARTGLWQFLGIFWEKKNVVQGYNNDFFLFITLNSRII